MAERIITIEPMKLEDAEEVVALALATSEVQIQKDHPSWYEVPEIY